MSNLSGVEDNKAFKTGIDPAEPYYYISAHLDLTGAEVGVLGNNYVYFFNKENNFNYLNSRLYPLGPNSYPGFYPIQDNAVIDEVVVYSGPDLVYTYESGDISDLDFSIGGAYIPSISDTVPNPLDVWGGPTGNVAGPIQGDLLTRAQVCYYGREPENPQPIDNQPSVVRKFLALNITRNITPLLPEPSLDNSRGSKYKRPKSQLGRVRFVEKEVKSRGRAPKIVRQVLSEDLIDSGMIYVVVKVYPKFQ
jgi:hypothetical protein